MLKGYDILCLASADWYAINRVNCHHVMARLSDGNKVLYIDSIKARTPALSETLKVLKRLKAFARGVQQVKERLYVLSPLVIPRYHRPFSRKINEWLLWLQINWAMSRVGLQRPLVWVFHPYTVDVLRHLQSMLTVYHCVDDYAANPGVSPQHMRLAERELLGSADLVFASSRGLYNRLSQIHPNVYYVPNVADVAHFRQALDSGIAIQADLLQVPRPRIGYIGNVSAYKLDFDLLEQLIRLNRNWSFVFIGPVGVGDPSTDISRLAGLPNAHFLGPRPYAELPGYLKAMDVCIIPFRLNEVTASSLPLKFFEYLSAGKPVVGTDLPALREFRDVYRAANSYSEFRVGIELALRDDADICKVKSRLALAAQYSWDKRMVELSRIVQAELDSRRAR